MFVIPVLGEQSLVVPWVLVASQPSLLSEFQANERHCFKEKQRCMELEEQHSRLSSGLLVKQHTYERTHAYAHTNITN